MKSEPSAFSLEDLKRRRRGTDHWDGVRNYQARNFLRAMSKGDLAFFYHSSCKQPGIVGIVEIVREAYPDPTAFDAGSEHFDADSTPDQPRWWMVDVRYCRHLRRPLPLSELKAHGHRLGDLALLRTGSRLSVMPVARKSWNYLLKLEESAPK